jgi:hypothetical protein
MSMLLLPLRAKKRPLVNRSCARENRSTFHGGTPFKVGCGTKLHLPPYFLPRLHEFLNQPRRWQAVHVPARVVSGSIIYFETRARHLRKALAQLRKFGFAELFN